MHGYRKMIPLRENPHMQGRRNIYEMFGALHTWNNSMCGIPYMGFCRHWFKIVNERFHFANHKTKCSFAILYIKYAFSLELKFFRQFAKIVSPPPRSSGHRTWGETVPPSLLICENDSRNLIIYITFKWSEHLILTK